MAGRMAGRMTGHMAGRRDRMAGNLTSSLTRRGCARPMDRYDRLPAELRAWLAGAALPWSAASALRLWTRLQRETGGDTALVLRRLAQAEARMLARDCPRIWGAAYPLDAPPPALADQRHRFSRPVETAD